MAEWLAAGQAGSPPPDLRSAESGGLTVNELILAYIRFADGYYVKDGRPTVEPTNIRLVLRLVRRLYGTTPANSFGPLALKAVRDEMIRAGNCRTEINRRVGRIVRMFKWGVSEELVPPGVYEALRTVAGLRKGRSAAKEKPPVKPVPDADVEAIRPHVSRQVWAMVELQRLTGMRPGEVVLMRTGDLDMAGDVWVYTSDPAQDRAPRQVAGDLHRAAGPGDPAALAAGRPRGLPVQPGGGDAGASGRAAGPPQDPGPAEPAGPVEGPAARRPGRLYTVASYRKAIQAACRKAGVARWHPHQLRHAAATEIRKRFRPGGLARHPGARGRAGCPDLRRGGPGSGGRDHAADRVIW